MTEIEDPDPSWGAVIADTPDAVVEWVGPAGYTLLSFIAVFSAAQTYATGGGGPIFGRLVGVEGTLFLLGFGAGGCLAVAVHLYGKDGDRS